MLIRGSRAPARDPKWAWVKRPFGWEAHSCASGGGACAPDAPKPVLYDAALLYSVKMSHEDVERGAQSSFILEVWEPEHSEATRASARLQAALDVARQFAEHIDAELIKYRWVAKLLQNGVARLARPVVAIQQLNLVAEDELSAHGALGSHELTVHLGDDLSVVAAWWAYQFDLSHEASESFFAQLSELFPQHSSASWIAERTDALASARDVPFPRVPETEQMPVVNASFWMTSPPPANLAERAGTGPCVTIAMTTCKRLHHFRTTARTLLAALDRGLARAHFALCSILVVDDGSPPHERAAMIEEFGDRFTFLLKPAGAKATKGHADSMNTLLAAVRSRYLVYLEVRAHKNSARARAHCSRHARPCVSRHLRMTGRRSCRRATSSTTRSPC